MHQPQKFESITNKHLNPEFKRKNKKKIKRNKWLIACHPFLLIILIFLIKKYSKTLRNKTTFGSGKKIVKSVGRGSCCTKHFFFLILLIQYLINGKRILSL